MARCISLCMVTVVLASTAGGCSNGESPYAPRFSDRAEAAASYTFAVHPLHNPALLHRTYGPMVEYLNRHVPGAAFRLISSRDYESFNRRMAAGEFDFALPNPYQAVEATHSGYRIFGKVAKDDQFRGVILVRRGSSINKVADLRGKTISYPAPTAVAATMMPQLFIRSHGVRLEETRTVYVGSMESSIQSVVSGASDAAAIWPDPWEKYVRSNPVEASKLVVKWVTPPLVNNALVVRRSIPNEVTGAVLTALVELGKTSEGRRLLEHMSVPGFEPATEATYAPVKRFLADFSAKVRPLPGRAEPGA